MRDRPPPPALDAATPPSGPTAPSAAAAGASATTAADTYATEAASAVRGAPAVWTTASSVSSAPFPTRGRERYQVIAEHGRGGLGVVNRALDTELRRPVAIKELQRRGDYLEARFFREALITARLEHPGIVPVHEAGRWPDGTPFYAMKLVSGRPLDELIAGAATPSDRLGLLSHVIAVADAIAYAHDLHVIHRDLKPANILVGDFGETVVIDWGLAKDLRATDGDEHPGASAPGDDHLTALGSVMGTPAYMAPEQAAGANVDERADVFALGAILFELVVGRPPRADAADPPALRRALERAQTPADLQAIIIKAIAWEPGDRYPSAGPLADDLRRYDRGARVAAHHYTWRALLVRFARRHRVLVALSLAFAAILVAGAALSVRRIRSERDHAVAAQATAVMERNRVIRVHAESALASDPTSAAAWLGRLPETELETAGSRQIALRARALGVATQVLEPGAPVPYVAFTPDGARLVTCGSGTLTLWSVDGARLRTTRGECFSGLPVSADGARVYFSASPGGIGEWRLDTGATRIAYASDRLIEPILTAADGQVAAGADAELVRGAAGGALTAMPGMRGHLRALSERGAWMATIDERGAAWLTELATGRHEALAADAPVRQLRFADDDRVLLLVHDDGGVGSVALDDAARRELRWDAPPTDALSTGGGIAALVQRSESVSLWDVRTRTHLADIARVPAPSMTRVSPDGAWLAVGSKSGPVLLYERATGYAVTLLGHRSRIADIRFQPGGDGVATASSDGTVRLWRRSDLRVRVVATAARPVRQLAISPDQTRLAAAIEGGDLMVQPWRGGDPRWLGGHSQTVTALAFSTRGAQLASRAADCRAEISDPASGQRVATLDGAVNDVAFSPDGAVVVTARTDGQVVAARLADGVTTVLGRHPDEARWVRFLDADTVISAGADGAVVAWDHPGGAPTALYAHAGGVLFMAVVAGSRLVTVGADGTLVVWSRAAMARVAAGARPRALAVSPAGTRCMVADASGELRTWTLASIVDGGPPRRQVHYPSPMRGLCFLDEDTAFGASDDGALLSWRGDAELVDAWSTDASGNTAIACRAAGDGSGPEVVTATGDGKIRSWPVPQRDTPASVRALLDQATHYHLSP